MPIGAEQTANGYEVAWKVTGADQFTVWTTTIAAITSQVLLTSCLERAPRWNRSRPVFHQDLNGDGSIGVPPPPPPPVIEAFGSTSLGQVGSNYFLYPMAGRRFELSYGGAPVVAGQFGAWVPIGAEQTANGYEVAWKVTGADQFTVWNHDNSGNYVSSAFDIVSGTSAALQSIETSFPPRLERRRFDRCSSTASPPVIEAFGSTSLVRLGATIFFIRMAGRRSS